MGDSTQEMGTSNQNSANNFMVDTFNFFDDEHLKNDMMLPSLNMLLNTTSYHSTQLSKVVQDVSQVFDKVSKIFELLRIKDDRCGGESSEMNELVSFEDDVRGDLAKMHKSISTMEAWIQETSLWMQQMMQQIQQIQQQQILGQLQAMHGSPLADGTTGESK
ncbi:uncharacterized protein PAC_05606 [Phialocephala subalpina]|uniref:Uncharacterized protein n=1 Tax=Phialocephala subalpina TaxID=576137 RepID=A0A1L7WSG5_9HELO|nr:uncharacterized protein PAC_05606 [Phialocephala subalpina]